MNGAIGLDIGGTKLLASLVTSDGTVVARRRAPTPAAEGPVAVLDAAAQLIAELQAPATLAVGVGSAGTIDGAGGIVRYATDSLPGWAGTPIRDEIARRTKRRVVVENDVNAAAIGESWVGAGREHDRVLLIAAGTGLGGGLVDAGTICRSASGAGLDVAHLPVTEASDLCGCGRTGHLEAVASGTAVARNYTRRTAQLVAGADVARRAAGGDVDALAVIERAGITLGRALAGLVAVLYPDIVVLTGGAVEPMIPHTLRAFDSEVLPHYDSTPVVPGERGGDAVAVGAAKLAMEVG